AVLCTARVVAEALTGAVRAVPPTRQLMKTPPASSVAVLPVIVLLRMVRPPPLDVWKMPPPLVARVPVIVQPMTAAVAPCPTLGTVPTQRPGPFMRAPPAPDTPPAVFPDRMLFWTVSVPRL